MKTKREYNTETRYRVHLTQSDTNTLAPITYLIDTGPFNFQDYLTVEQAEHLRDDLTSTIEMVKRNQAE